MNAANNALEPIIGAAGLQIDLLGGSVSTGAAATTFPIQTVNLAQNATNFVYLNTATVAIVVNQTGFPTSSCYPIAKVVTGVSSVTSLTDSRPDLTFTGEKVIASGTVALGTSSINSGAAATTVTVSAPGTLTTDNILADFNADPTGTTGYAPSANGMLTIVKFPTADNVNFIVINNTAGAITPGAVTLNWRVVR